LADDEQPKKLTRSARKRRETRRRIIAATAALMQTRPLDELAIAEITEAADVGHGTFYLHFDSKYEVVVPIINQHFAYWDAAAQAAASDLDDPAQVVSHSARQIGRIIVGGSLYRWFLQQSGVPVEDLRAALGLFVARDIRQGIESGRFLLPQSEAAMNFLFGGIVAGLMSCFDTEDSDSTVDDLVELLLRGLGLPAEEAHEIAHVPLQALDTSQAPSFENDLEP